MRLSDDAVPNVRQYFCALAQHASASDFFKETSEDISIQMRKRLEEIMKNDQDMEIRYQAQVALGDIDPNSAELSVSKAQIDSSTMQNFI